MRIDHAAIWTSDLEKLKTFYVTYFEAKASQKYTNPTRQFKSYFLSFASGTRLELMQMFGVRQSEQKPEDTITGYAHLAFAAGSEAIVDELTARLRKDGYIVVREPHRTGDGYFESVILDPDSNRVEITV
jgi:lactoylglutathione lyase